MKIGLNSDMGEGFGRYSVADDATLMRTVSSANIACGFHAGDPQIMARMVALAKAGNVEIGAHAGFADRESFGRRRIPMDAAEVVQQVLYQVGALHAITTAQGYRMQHFSFHGAMGYMVGESEEMSVAVLEAIRSFDPGLFIYGMACMPLIPAAKRMGFKTVGLVFVDRAYDDEGMLVSRQLPNAVLHDEAEVAARVSQFMDDGTVTTITGKRIAIDAQAFLVHSDTPGSAELASLVRRTVENGGGQVLPLAQVVA